MELPPNALSSRDYHDATLVGILPERGSVSLHLRTVAQERMEVRMTGVRWLLATDVLAGNIVERIDAHEITNENVNVVLALFEELKSEYFSPKAISSIRAAGGLVGLRLISVHPSYGAYILVVCERVEEFGAIEPSA
jgi:hypothetical protein